MELFSFGNFALRTSVLSVLAGAFIAYWFFRKNMKKNGYRDNTCEDIFLISVLTAIVGSRLFWYAEEKFEGISRFFHFYEDGFEVLGGMGLALIAIFIYCRKHYMSVMRTTDCGLPYVLLGLGIGRLGFYPANHSVLWIALLNLLGFILIEYVYGKFFHDKRRGDRTAMTILWIGFSRFFVRVFQFGSGSGRKADIFFGGLAALVGLGLYAYVRMRKLNERPVVLFDLDGTLVDSEKLVRETYRGLFEKYKTLEEFTQEIQLQITDPIIDESIMKMFPEESKDEITQEFDTLQLEMPKLGVVKMMDHAEDLLIGLARNGYRIAIISSRTKESTDYWVEEFDLDEYIDTTVGNDSVAAGVPSVDGILKACEVMKTGHDSCVYIGNTVNDIRSAIGAGVYTIAFAKDDDRRAELEREKPDRIITSLTELDAILEEKRQWAYKGL